MEWIEIKIKYLFKNILTVNEGKITALDVLTDGERIQKVASSIDTKEKVTEVNGEGKYLLPGVIDDQVHFREPGLTHKANIYTESKAAVAGGVTTFMEMPNTVPNALTIELLEDKYNIWSGVIGGFFLALSYFGTDQSQVGRYLTAKDTRESRLGLLMNGLVKVPLQFFILIIGCLLFAYYSFFKAPAFFNKTQEAVVLKSNYAGVYKEATNYYSQLQ